MPIIKNVKPNEAAMQLVAIQKTRSTESTVGVNDAEPKHLAGSPPRHRTTTTRKRSSSQDGDNELSPRSRKSIFLSSPRLPMRNEELEGMMMIRRCDAFDEDSDRDENENESHVG